MRFSLVLKKLLFFLINSTYKKYVNNNEMLFNEFLLLNFSSKTLWLKSDFLIFSLQKIRAARM